MLAAYIVLRVQGGKAAIDKLFAPLLHWKVSVAWYIIAILSFAVIGTVAAALSGNLTEQLKNLNISSSILITYVSYLVAAIPEEVAWRGFALPRLQTRYSALASSIIIGVLWALWHLPLLLIADNVMSTYPKYLFSIKVGCRFCILFLAV